MSQEHPQNSPGVHLVCAAYLAQSEPETTIEAPPPPADRVTTALAIGNNVARIVCGVMFTAVAIVVGTSVWGSYSKEKDRRTCGVDWILWAMGSEKTFQDKLNDAIEESRRDFDERMAESKIDWKSVEIKPLDIGQFNPTFGQPLGSPPMNHRKR